MTGRQYGRWYAGFAYQWWLLTEVIPQAAPHVEKGLENIRSDMLLLKAAVELAKAVGDREIYYRAMEKLEELEMMRAEGERLELLLDMLYKGR